MSETPPITALDALRAIAHPVRIQIYELLVLDGPDKVSQIAEKVNLAVGSASYHLAQLHQVGLVEEATELSSDRRTHWWRAVPGGLRWSPADFLESAGGREVSTSAQRMLTERRIRRLGEWNASWHRWPRDWINAAVETDTVLHLTPQELTCMAGEISAVVRRWADRPATASSSAASGDQTEEAADADAAERQPIFMFLSAFPVEKQ